MSISYGYRYFKYSDFKGNAQVNDFEMNGRLHRIEVTSEHLTFIYVHDLKKPKVIILLARQPMKHLADKFKFFKKKKTPVGIIWIYTLK